MIRKNGRLPTGCPKCGETAGRANGTRRTVEGTRQQVRRTNCRHQWVLVSRAGEVLFEGLRLHIGSDRLLRGFGLVALGLPMYLVEQLTGIKAETLKKKLEWVLDQGRWDALDDELERQFEIPRFYRDELRTRMVVLREFDKNAFRAWAAESRPSDPSGRSEVIRLGGRIAGFPGAAEMIRRWARQRPRKQGGCFKPARGKRP